MRLATLVLCACGLTAAAPRQAVPDRLNIISIVTDDQARWSIGAYGNRESITPNMDRIAREGARFENAFVATPVCSPSRVAFLTGRYGTQVGITDYLAPVEQDAGAGLPPGVAIWPQVLHDKGWATALVGKWHLGARPEHHPTRRGFDHFYGFLGGGNTPMDPTLEVEGKETKLRGVLPDLMTDDALRFIEANRARPFALLLHFREPHLPYGPVPEVDSAPFKNLDPTIPDSPGIDRAQVKGWTRDYYASIHAVDRNLGRLLDRLDALDLTRRTIVLFTSDHGYNIGHHGIHAKGNGFWVAGGVAGPKRPNMWDTSIRVPLLVRWPGVVKPGHVVRETVTNLDTFASVLGMLGVEAPRGHRHEGMDFSPLLRGEKRDWRDTLFGQYDLHNAGLAYMRMIRTPRYKLVRHYFENLMDELYDLERDPEEKTNLARPAGILDPKLRATHDDLLRRLVEWQKSINDPILDDPRRRP